MKQILVPTDFSPTALKALHFAAGLALRCGATLHLMHAYTLLENVFVDNSSMRNAWNQKQQDEKQGNLLALKQLMAENYPALSVVPHLFIGPPVAAILQYASQQKIDMILMGTQGASGLVKVLVGSVTADLLSKSPIPVLAIPEKYEGGTPEYIMLGTKNFEMNEHIIRPVIVLASLYDLPVNVMKYEVDDEDADKKQKDVRLLENYVNDLQQKNPLIKFIACVIEGEDFELAIDDYTKMKGNGIFCMITYHRSFWDRLLDPSLTKEMAYHTKVPLLAIPIPSYIG